MALLPLEHRLFECETAQGASIESCYPPRPAPAANTMLIDLLATIAPLSISVLHIALDYLVCPYTKAPLDWTRFYVPVGVEFSNDEQEEKKEWEAQKIPIMTTHFGGVPLLPQGESDWPRCNHCVSGPRMTLLLQLNLGQVPASVLGHFCQPQFHASQQLLQVFACTQGTFGDAPSYCPFDKPFGGANEARIVTVPWDNLCLAADGTLRTDPPPVTGHVHTRDLPRFDILYWSETKEIKSARGLLTNKLGGLPCWDDEYPPKSGKIGMNDGPRCPHTDGGVECAAAMEVIWTFHMEWDMGSEPFDTTRHIEFGFLFWSPVGVVYQCRVHMNQLAYAHSPKYYPPGCQYPRR